ncbi:tRNA delta(2)-isopentenylpyrophosphate transferase [Petrotoga sp. HKA.pet.4.5]|uniref:tRNA (adenosine(37)-N6)-dimethylallyltransferase MiaA n=1 Tax=unclassified Petrotoga TaxID=2620614 RepID=UPI000EF15A6A|nr:MULTISPECIES: tRNA (adenosine(37)-N6)-dimethylallyltransferase MiaA [unclassified Petrotoga]RLL85347.1 tRNA delta(2)-isopentenylpyrophosphate transferase [Petrotoga sp. Shatin.DS.tank11.9.2.9.3]RLL88951.1 tRNA delta(2)-isopentenylpyrophosphate transferase [Petrotoga sp. HKA.pet.4.5]
MNKVLVIAGPTAVGKTEISIEIARRINGEIICMDSRQIYSHLIIGTAMPDEETKKLVPHHLYGSVDPRTHFTAFDYKKLAEKKIGEILNRGNTPVLVGGTGLYLDALRKGFLNVKSDYGLRTYLRKLETNNPGVLRKILVDLDPQRAQKIHPNDLKRIIRAIEIYVITGIKMGEIVKENRQDENSFDYHIIVLDRERQELHERINKRVHQMIDEGLIEEVRNLLSLGYSTTLNALNTIGYKEVVQYLYGKIDFNEMVHQIKVNTRNYARRQIIYFRKIEGAKWINLSKTSQEEVVDQILSEFI